MSKMFFGSWDWDCVFMALAIEMVAMSFIWSNFF